MRVIIPVLTFFLLSAFSDFNFWSSLAITIWMGYVVHFLSNLNHSIAFREYILVMYGLNYLFSPALTYEVTQSIAVFKMRLDPETYFSLAIPAMFCLHAGLFCLKTKIFSYQFNVSRIQSHLNETVLKQWLMGGVLLSFISPFFPGELAFVVYLLSGIKYVGLFGLFIIDKRKYKWYLIAVLLLEVAGALRAGMFHDVVVWILFFSMVWTYLKKPGASTKFVLGTAAIFILFLLQTVKATYRQQVRSGEAGFGAFSDAVSKNSEGEGLFSFSNVALSLTRANQGWIFSSSVDHMNKNQNFQKMELVKKYAEAAILPRFLAPTKLEAGDKEIFNQFSGARIAKYSATSMALGLFADGYISYGAFGSLIFAFVFGLICAFTFRVIERWSSISPYFALFCFPLLNYAVRADCETQTWMGHIVKGLIVFGIVIHFAKQYFQRKTAAMVDADNNEESPETSPQLIPNTV